MKCIYCEKDFEIRPNGKSGGRNRQLCYDCLPEGIEDKAVLSSAASFYLRQKAQKQKIELGCSRCGYNKCGEALDWHHPNDNKEYNPSSLLSGGNWNSWNLFQKEIEKCVLLCANCHREEHAKDSIVPVFVGNDKYEKFREEVKSKYLETKSLQQTANFFSKDTGSIKRIIEFLGLPVFKNQPRKVQQLDKNTGEFIQEFESVSQACKAIGKTHQASGHIMDVCRGDRKTAYGYKWRYVE